MKISDTQRFISRGVPDGYHRLVKKVFASNKITSHWELSKPSPAHCPWYSFATCVGSDIRCRRLTCVYCLHAMVYQSVYNRSYASRTSANAGFRAVSGRCATTDKRKTPLVHRDTTSFHPKEYGNFSSVVQTILSLDMENARFFADPLRPLPYNHVLKNSCSSFPEWIKKY